MAGSRTHRFPKVMVNATDVETKWAAQDAATALVQTNLDTHTGTATIHRSINDAGVAVTDLWSADKITTMLAAKLSGADEAITPAKLDIDNAEVDTYVLSYDLGSTSFKWVDRLHTDGANIAGSGAGVDTHCLTWDNAGGALAFAERVKTDGSNLAVNAVSEAAIAIFTAPGAGVDKFAICYDHGNTRLDYMEMMLPDISNLSVEIPESVLEVVAHATALEDGYALVWNQVAGKMEWNDISAIVGADTYKIKWDGADVAEYLGLKLPRPTSGAGYEGYRVNADASAIELGAPVDSNNRIINSEMMIDQENEGAAFIPFVHGPGTSTAAMIDGMIVIAAALDDVHVSAQQAAAIGSSRSSLKFTITTAEVAVAVDELCAPFTQVLLGYNVADLNSKTVVLSFEFKSNAPDGSIFSVCLQAGDKSRSYVTDFTYVTSEAVQLVSKVITLEAATVTSLTTGHGLVVSIAACGGSNYNQAAGSWAAGAKYYSNNASLRQYILTLNEYIQIGSLELKPGSVYAPSPRKTYAQHLDDCLPYMCKSYSTGVAVSTVTALGMHIYRNMGAGAVADVVQSIVFPKSMAAVPTVALFSPVTGSTGKVRDYAAGVDISSTAQEIGTKAASWIDTGATTITAGASVGYHYLALARIGKDF